MVPHPPRKAAFTLLELLLAIAIFTAALVPIANLFLASQRTAFASERMIQAAAHAQALLEGILQLEPADLPALVPGRETTLLAEVDGRLTAALAGPAGRTRWTEVVDHFKTSQSPFKTREQSLSFAYRGILGLLIRDTSNPIPALCKPDRYLIKVKLEFLRLTHDRKTDQSTQEVTVSGMLAPGP